MDFYKQFVSEEFPGYSLIVEADGRVAYAYLLKDDKVISDVWLCNIAPTPAKVNWRNYEEMPFLNPSAFTKNKNTFDTSDLDDFVLEWSCNDNSVSVSLKIKEGFRVRLTSGAKPGWSTNVFKEGPLAKVLKSESII